MSFLPEADREYLSAKSILYEEVVEGPQKAVLFSQWALPPSKYNNDSADILVLLPAGYPDVNPDMFYSDPWLKLQPQNSFPKAATVNFNFMGKSWQRWSRHNNEWRPGTDGIWTMVKRIQHAIEVATA